MPSMSKDALCILDIDNGELASGKRNAYSSHAHGLQCRVAMPGDAANIAPALHAN